ncbi:hypothetical protein L1887_37197 [Cichorium endivia]|nr:hypothetical protein L1887_37197 [Cichorium endivia]
MFNVDFSHPCGSMYVWMDYQKTVTVTCHGVGRYSCLSGCSKTVIDNHFVAFDFITYEHLTCLPYASSYVACHLICGIRTFEAGIPPISVVHY